jgi:hypothetical protein
MDFQVESYQATRDRELHTYRTSSTASHFIRKKEDKKHLKFTKNASGNDQIHTVLGLSIIDVYIVIETSMKLTGDDTMTRDRRYRSRGSTQEKKESGHQIH